MLDRIGSVQLAASLAVWVGISLAGCGDEQAVAGGDTASSSGTGTDDSGVDVTGGPTGPGNSTMPGATGGSSDDGVVDDTAGPPIPDMGTPPPDCPHDGPPIVDPAALGECTPSCAGAHCVPAALVPMDQQDLLAPCMAGAGDGFCTPDVFIETGGNFLLEACESVGGAEGRCLSACLPDVAEQAALLPQSTCGDGDLCVPCYDPFTQEETGVCSFTCDRGPTEPPLVLECPHVGPPLLDPTTLPECDPACGGAHCMDGSLVPMDLQAALDMCPGGFCVPDPLIETAGNYIPTTCLAFPGTTAEGRCLSDCLPQVQDQIDQLQQDVCADDERCVPCNDPFDGTDTGACATSSCDMPVDPPYVFPTCCPNAAGVDEGTCVSEAILGADAADLNQLTCPMDLLCVPNEYLPDSPVPIQTCNSGLGSGACVSDCVDLGIGGIFGQADCTDNHTCVPCWAGPPGCP